ncbi:mitogen-activated protein kinase-binding protein 1-like [Acipenser oxyrinchus oxyrinchus]|uniref:Mitogen-activated protein kinase-binding protein 1-like n=1 Tax=Acipenser oxyrinchus oxyrinchus TaxID=40147 RepID=A0AAD8D1D2_ACIOX|nr:mitogen-activated protein kinase-binding protein 1-like [Acipenser oxyrinchus oxyrinchus]KAK1160616.1 mitogen-activated protein kinase-binding protein 1-like [Acipenser oxyrinchus oxyrinchus]
MGGVRGRLARVQENHTAGDNPGSTRTQAPAAGHAVTAGPGRTKRSEEDRRIRLQVIFFKMTVEGSTIKSRIKNLLRSPSIKLRRNKAGSNKESLGNKVTLEKVLGITASGSSGLACDPRTGLVAYPAG